jgi:hypothetical protein
MSNARTSAIAFDGRTALLYQTIPKILLVMKHVSKNISLIKLGLEKYSWINYKCTYALDGFLRT